MTPTPSRRRFLTCLACGVPTLTLARSREGTDTDGTAVDTATLREGDLTVVLRDNARSPQVLSGVASLVHQRAAPAFDAFDPDSRGASAGLNFEHIICGHPSP